MNAPPFAPGFRLSFLDLIVLVCGAGASLAAASFEVWFGVTIAFVVAHFFLFCNVFRVDRNLEFAWSFLFLLLMGCTIKLGLPPLHISLIVSLVGTVLVIYFQMRQPWYHGTGWRVINPGLPQWWETRNAAGGSQPSA